MRTLQRCTSLLTVIAAAVMTTVPAAASTAAPVSPARSAEPRSAEPRAAAPVPSLSRVLWLVGQRGPSAVLGRAAVSTTRAGYAGARLLPLGNPYVEITAERATASGPRQVGLGAAVWLPVEVFGQRSGRIAETDAAVRLAEKGQENVRALAAGEAIRSFGAAAAFSERLRVLDELMDVARTEAASYDARLTEGDATVQDARLARVEVARYAVQREETGADLVLALSDLSRLTGTTFDAPPSAPLRAPRTLTAAVRVEAPALAVRRAEAAYFARAKERAESEALGPVSVIVSGGRNEFGEPRVGGGFAYAIPALRRNQAEVARAEAERSRALTELRLSRQAIETRLAALAGELDRIRSALAVLDSDAEPAARASVEAALDMRSAGKGEHLVVLTSRRDLALLRLRRLDLVLREWGVVGEIAALTGTTRIP